VPHPLTAAANSVAKHVRRSKLRRNSPFPDVCHAVANCVFRSDWVYIEEIDPDVACIVDFHDLYDMFWNEVLYTFRDVVGWHSRLTRLSGKEAARMLGSFKAEMQSVYKEVPMVKAEAAGNRYLEVPIEFRCEGTVLDDIDGMDFDFGDFDISDISTVNPKAKGHEKAQLLGVSPDLWTAFTAWAEVHPDLADDRRDSGIILKDFYARDAVDTLISGMSENYTM